MNGYLLDTHVWVWIAHAEIHEVSANFFLELEDWQRRGVAHLSPFSCWEISLLILANRLRLDYDVLLMWERDTMPGSFLSADLSATVLIESTRLPGELHRDPADRILVATARVYGLTLVTRDKKLLDYAKQGHIRARKP